tara:strand:- start:1252 stop:2610 length:1359 start_codon:yes stop_codon:yes gene_type:complete
MKILHSIIKINQINFIINLKNKFIFKKKFLFTFFFKAISSLGILLFNILMLNFYDEEINGTIAILLSFLIGASVFLGFGLRHSILKNLSIFFELKLANDLFKFIKKYFILFLILNIFIISLIIYFRYELSLILFKTSEKGNYFLFISFIMPVFTLLTLQKSIFKSFKKPEISTIVDNGAILLVCCSLIFIINLLTGIILNEIRILFLIILSIFIIFFISSIITLILVLNIGISKDKYNFKFKSDNLFHFFLLDSSYYLRVWGLMLPIGILLSEMSTGIFSAIFWLSNTLIFIPVIVNTVFSPYFAIHGNNDNKKNLFKFYNNAKIYLYYFNLPILILYIFFGEHLLDFLYSIEDKNTIISFKLISIAIFLRYIFGPIDTLFILINKEKIISYITIIISITEIAMVSILVLIYGFIGISVAILFSEILRLILIFIYTDNFNKNEIFNFRFIVK